MVATRFERGRDVLHAERFYSEERTQTEAFVPGTGRRRRTRISVG